MLSDEQARRYARNMAVDVIGEKGQERLLASRVMVVGTGGLGSPVCLYLAAAGVGTIGVVDQDIVELSNLQRQIIHRTADLGLPKVESAQRSINGLNPDVRVIPHKVRISDANATELIAGYDVVVSAVDNFRARYALNDACVRLRKPMVEAGVVRFDGLAMTIVPGKGACYRCLFPDEPPETSAEGQKRLGIVGSVAGLLGTIQATEVIKLLTGVGVTITGRALLVNTFEMSFREITVERDPECRACGALG